MKPTSLTPIDLWTNPDLVASFLDVNQSRYLDQKTNIKSIKSKDQWIESSLLCGYTNKQTNYIMYSLII